MKLWGKFFLAVFTLSLLSYGVSSAAYAVIEPLSVHTNKEFWELYKKIGGNTVRNIAHLRTLIEEITSKQKGQK